MNTPRSLFLKVLSFLFLAVLPAGSLPALEFRVLSWSETIGDLKFRQGREETAIVAEERVLSPVYTLAGAGPLELYRTAVVDGKPVRKTVATLASPAGISRGLLVLSPAGAAGGYTGLWLDDSPESNPAGTFRLHNFSSRTLAVKIGAEQCTLAPAGTQQVRFEPTARAVPVQVAAQVGGEWQRVVSASQPVRARYRLLVVLRDGRPTADEPAAMVDWLTFYEVPTPPVKGAVASR